MNEINSKNNVINNSKNITTNTRVNIVNTQDNKSYLWKFNKHLQEAVK